MEASNKLITLALLFAVTGCGAPTLYVWGNYQELLYQTYLAPGSVDPQDEIGQISEQIERTEQGGKLVPPGLRAHLAALLYQTGDREGSASMFLAEKEAFPESAVFVDGMIERMSK
jgi:hypothetical protein